MRMWGDRECPTDSRDAYYEGRRSESYERNPYEHGSDPWADRDCREAHEEWERGHRAAEYDREERQREAEDQRRAERRACERQQEEAHYEEQYYEQQQYPEPDYPEPSDSATGERND